MKTQLSYQMGDGHIVAGNIPAYFDTFVFSDIEEKIILPGSSIDMHYERVMSVVGNSYKCVDKHVYADTLQAIKAIVNCKTHHLKSPIRAKAIAFLHQEIKFSPSTIQRILLLFGVKMEITKILKDSEKIFSETLQPSWIQRYLGGAF